MAESHREEIAKLEALYASNPGGRVFVHLAEAYRKAGELELARGILSEGLARHTDSASGYVVLGRVLTDLGDTSEAETAFRRVLELDAGNLIALRGLGDLALESGRPTDALVLYRELLARNPSNEEVRTLIGDVERRNEQDAEPEPASGQAEERAVEAQDEAPTGDEGPAGTAAAVAEVYGGEAAYDPAQAGAGAGPMLTGGDAEPHAAADGQTPEAADEPSAGMHGSADEPGGPQLESEPVDAPVAPFSAAPGDTADAVPPEPVLLDARDETGDPEPGDALPGDLASFAGVADEAMEEAGEPVTTDDEEAIAFATDDRELDVEELLQAASAEAEDFGTVGDAEPLDIETFDAADAPIDLPALELGVEQDVAADAGGSAAEFEGALDIGADLMPAAEFVGVFDEDDAPADEGAGPGDLDIELRFDDADATGAAAGAGSWSDDEFPELSLADEEPVVSPAEDWHASEFAAAAGQEEPAESDEAAEAGSTFTFWSGDDDVTTAHEATTGVAPDAPDPSDSADAAEAWRLPGRQEPQERGLETETMADLYRAQGFHDRAAEVYRALLRRRPGDERLEARLRELEELKAGGRPEREDREAEVDDSGEAWLRGAGSAWTGGQEADASPYVWAEPGLAGQEEEGEPIGSYLAALTAWTPPGAGGATPAAADESAAQEAAADLELEPLEAGTSAGAAAEAAGEPGGESWTDSVDYGYEPWTDTAASAGTEADTEAGADPGVQPAAASADATQSAGPTPGTGPSGRRDVVEAAFDEWYGEPAPQPQASSQDEDDAEDDEDLAMFRSWLQSLKK